MATKNAINSNIPIEIAKGGTNATSMTDTDGVAYFDGTRLVTTAVGTATHVLTSNGPAVAPTFQAGSGVSGTTNHAVQVGNAGGTLTSLAVGATGTVLLGSGADPGWTGSPTISGTVTVGTGLTAATGNITTNEGNFGMATTTATRGILTLGGHRWLHAFGYSCIFLGYEAGALDGAPVGMRNTGIGSFTLGSLTSGTGNNVIGYNAGNGLTTGGYNSVLGYESLKVNTTGTANVAVGQNALYFSTTGGWNIAVGFQPVFTLTTGDYNTAVGYKGLYYVTTGDANTAVGYFAGGNYRSSESDNLAIGNAGVVGESNVIRLGTDGVGRAQQNKCFIAAIRGTTTVNADAIAVLIDSDGQLGTVSSSRKVKENIVDMGSDSEKIYSLRPVSFAYKKDEKKAKQYGLIAEEVAEVFPWLAAINPDGECESVKYHELPALLLNELIKLKKEVADLRSELIALSVGAK